MRKRHGHSVKRLRKESSMHMAFVSGALLVAAGAVFFAGYRGTITISPEVHFTDASKSGLAIVPASCPSAPDWTGSCTSYPSHYCTISVSPSSYPSGTVSNVTITWNADEAQGINSSYADNGASDLINPQITGIGAVYPQGTETIAAPQSSVTYVFSGNYSTGETLSCSAQLNVSSPPSYSGYMNQVEPNRSVVSVTPTYTMYSPVAPGDTVYYRIYVSNTGADQGSYTAVDAVPAGSHLEWQGGGTTNTAGAPSLCTQDTSLVQCLNDSTENDWINHWTYTGTPAVPSNIWWTQTPSKSGFYTYLDMGVTVDATGGVSCPDGSGATCICNTPAYQTACPNGGSCGGTVYNYPANTICNPISVCPASVQSAPYNPSGYYVSAGLSGERITQNTSPICVSNSSVNNYFVPSQTGAEIQSFENHLPSGASYTNLSQ